MNGAADAPEIPATSLSAETGSGGFANRSASISLKEFGSEVGREPNNPSMFHLRVMLPPQDGGNLPQNARFLSMFRGKRVS
jgi:hypothetical protein